MKHFTVVVAILILLLMLVLSGRSYEMYDPTTTCESTINSGLCNGPLVSGIFKALQQTDGNYCVYKNDTPVWCSNTAGVGGPPYNTYMQGDGNLCMYDGKRNPMWCSDTPGKGTGPYKASLEAGKFCAFDSTNTPLWCSHTGVLNNQIPAVPPQAVPMVPVSAPKAPKAPKAPPPTPTSRWGGSRAI
jgi:hypothetical protein